MRQAVLWAATGIVAMTLAACAGFGGATIGGTLGGLGTGLNVVLQDNGADNLTLTANGSFTFATNIGEGKTYNVTVATQPAGQVCTVANGSGTVDKSGTDVTGVSVSCATTSALLSGTITGLKSGGAVTLLLNGTTSLIVAGTGTGTTFSFPTALANSTYVVTVSGQPTGQTCTVTNGSGSIVTTAVTPVKVNCV